MAEHVLDIGRALRFHQQSICIENISTGRTQIKRVVDFSFFFFVLVFFISKVLDKLSSIAQLPELDY